MPEILDDRYLLREEHQSGGMATIYRAIRLDNDGLVAIKRFDREKHLPKIEAEAYRREVEALQNLQHPNILRIIEHGEDSNRRPYLVLEWMPNDLVSLRERGSTAFDGWDDFADQIALPLLEALAHAHAQSYCHRDVKPANVLIADDGQVKLADFGISKLKRCLQPRITLNEFASRPYAPPERDVLEFSYSSDVYAFGVLCLWALSDKAILTSDDVACALTSIDVVPGVREILARCVHRDPTQRPRTAGVLAHELSRVQAERRAVWALKDKKHCRVNLSRGSMATLGDFIQSHDESKIRRFVEGDINDCSTIGPFYARKGTPEERLIPDQYFVCGARIAYQIGLDDNKGSQFIAIKVLTGDPWRLQQMKRESLPTPVTFDFTVRVGATPAKDIVPLLAQALMEFEEEKRRESSMQAEESLFTGWRKLLDAKAAFERESCAPIQYDSSVVEGRFLTLRTSGQLEDVEIEQPRLIEADGNRVRGTVYRIDGDRVVLYCPDSDLLNAPERGTARLDTWASNVSLDRQRTAIEVVRNGCSARPDLRTLLLDPSTCRTPIPVDGDFGLDDPYQLDALRAALGSPDMLVVQGPPGTGKTLFIENLIRETLRRDPSHRVILSSQTHVAIDNVLERLAVSSPNLPMLRIAQRGPSVVSEVCRPYLVDNQLDLWRNDVSERTSRWLREWARKLGLDPDELEAGTMLLQIADLREKVDKQIAHVREAEQKIEMLRESHGSESLDVLPLELDAIERATDEHRVQLASDKKYLDQLEDQFRRKREDSEEFLSLPKVELSEWGRILLGDSPDGRRAAEVLGLHAEWLDRFGRDKRAYVGALCERSSVVSGTCVGLAPYVGPTDLPYDLCIIDEASTATATQAMIPMIRSKRWVFVGDSRQLPPFEDQAHRDPNLCARFDIDPENDTESLFERLRRLLPASCQKMLRRQYRMVPPLGRLISECFYDAEVESEERPLDPRLVAVLGRAVGWITTRHLDARRENRDGPSFINTAETDVILEILESIHEVTSDHDEPVTVLVLSGYAGQVRLVQRLLSGMRHRLDRLDIACSTVDSVQGRQANVVIFSVTRSNEDSRAGFLHEFKRVNVALSRAQELLVIVGDDEFVRHSPGAEPLIRVLRHIEANPEDCVLEIAGRPGPSPRIGR
jgi:serine/threonine protein kinase